MGSIPACAGEPALSLSLPCPPEVYPRVCGGTAQPKRRMGSHQGLSPRVRGNHGHPSVRPDGQGSIPACAGEPIPLAIPPAQRWVYPRVCGGTVDKEGSETMTSGLSPRVRGNPVSGSPPRARMRSIPACAGEPTSTRTTRARQRVYPRVCGGTFYEVTLLGVGDGLSPRVRGNRIDDGSILGVVGSIPACAGEPFRRCQHGRRCRVYPRVCGGTNEPSGATAAARGLSPRVRGNRERQDARRGRRRSIPACAGEPRRLRAGIRRSAVYPRVCGGTTRRAGRTTRWGGLSPRVRGNPMLGGNGSGAVGSIPACAGEPRRRPIWRGRRKVYPRVCGGTFW